MLSWPSHIDAVTGCICRDMEQNFVSSLEAKLQFMQLRGMTDPYELAQFRQDFINERLPQAQQLLDKYLEVIPEYLAATGCSDDEFEQGWALMGGIWNQVIFEKVRPIVRLQQRYPQVLEVAKVLGRIADNEGSERVPVGGGNQHSVSHSTPSDIAGVGTGNDLSALLPLEMAQMADDELSGLFAYKFATRRLQTFDYKSQILNPTHKLQLHRARPKGPMLVCLDTSASMQGVPTEVAHSLVVKLLQIALRQDRGLLVITFSTRAQAYDVRLNRARLLEFFKSTPDGGTEAESMIEQLVATLCNNPAYAGADVCVVSDFHIPIVNDAHLRQMRQLHEAGTRFYGLQIGENRQPEWNRHFDKIYKIEYKTRQKPWFIQK